MKRKSLPMLGHRVILPILAPYHPIKWFGMIGDRWAQGSEESLYIVFLLNKKCECNVMSKIEYHDKKIYLQSNEFKAKDLWFKLSETFVQKTSSSFLITWMSIWSKLWSNRFELTEIKLLSISTRHGTWTFSQKRSITILFVSIIGQRHSVYWSINAIKPCFTYSTFFGF